MAGDGRITITQFLPLVKPGGGLPFFIMANGLDIISEEDFIRADEETARGWNHRILVGIYEQNKEAAESLRILDEKIEGTISAHNNCPGKNYRPVIDKVLVSAMGLIGGFLAVLVALKTKLISTVTG